MKTFNQYDEVIVQLQKHNLYHAQVVSDDGQSVQVILKHNTRGNKDFMFDREYGITHNMIVEKTYDAKTDKNLEEEKTLTFEV